MLVKAIKKFGQYGLFTASSVLPIPTPVSFIGKDGVRKLCQAIYQSGFKKVMLVTDQGTLAAGLGDIVTAHADEVGLKYKIFDQIEPDPSKDIVAKGVAFYNKHKCQAIIALGGGSSIDAAKVMAATASSDVPIHKLYGFFKVWSKVEPLFVIPTTAGTGSEVTVGAVITDRVKLTKNVIADPRIIPKMLALDPDMTVTLPPHITAATGMDALTHAVESYISTVDVKSSMDNAKVAVAMIFENLKKAYDEPTNTEAREGMALAAYLAGLAINKNGLGYVHCFAHNVGARYKVPHGLANAIIMPYVLEYSKDKPVVEKRLAELAKVASISGKGDSDKKAAQKFIQAIKDLNDAVGIPTKMDALVESEIPDVAKAAMKESLQLAYPVPKIMNTKTANELLKQMLV